MSFSDVKMPAHFATVCREVYDLAVRSWRRDVSSGQHRVVLECALTVFVPNHRRIWTLKSPVADNLAAKLLSSGVCTRVKTAGAPGGAAMENHCPDVTSNNS